MRANFKFVLPSINSKPGHHESGVPLLFANVDGLSPPAHVGMPGLDDVGGIDEHVGVDVGRVNPFASEVLWQ